MVLIIIASVLLVLAVLAQHPKSGMAANFGASNQVIGVRQTTDFLEKSTWVIAISIFVFTLLATMTMPTSGVGSRSIIEEKIQAPMQEQTFEVPIAAQPEFTEEVQPEAASEEVAE
ncbi:MAG: preprotein translocase subunit SecG [Rikenellaceae bacterium]